jgi:predicted SprT family Zn-dependent metalloprotease
MDIKNKQMIEALKEELKHYEIYKKADRAEQVKKEIKALGGKIENKSAKPKAEKKVVKK